MLFEDGDWEANFSNRRCRIQFSCRLRRQEADDERPEIDIQTSVREGYIVSRFLNLAHLRKSGIGLSSVGRRYEKDCEHLLLFVAGLKVLIMEFDGALWH